MEFEPNILAFCCQFCAYSAADLAGSMRLQYPPNVRIIRLLCTGKVDPLHLLKPFQEGWDGVFVAGCLEGECYFLHGNLHAKQWVNYTKKLLKEIGIEPERLEMFNMSAAMGTKFADTVREMTERIKKLGPSPLRGTEELKNRRTEEQVTDK
ncbi:MAG: hydrogenase iron-sulfur subunit [Planctomycetota bacterium]|nr:hydrogenase iron-sulfur subunit [Planctomycetota bacterium]MDI6788070.1 hydrogenase iron-sulfur subunit [Planctomycetota bacterium]